MRNRKEILPILIKNPASNQVEQGKNFLNLIPAVPFFLQTGAIKPISLSVIEMNY